MKPACVQTCVGSARLFGDLDNPSDPVAQIVMSGAAQPLMAHFGTRPNVYYIEDMKRKG
jgi:Fe-S-cluster-containing dehydrogenase component